MELYRWENKIGREKQVRHAIAVIMRMLVLIVVLAVLLLAMDAVAAESRRMLGDQGGGSAPGSPLPNPNQFHHG
jgi:hypothetical protein